MKKNYLIFVSFAASAAINIILWLLLAGKFGWQTRRVPLHFSVVYGIDFSGSARQVYEIAAAGLAVIVINFILNKWFQKIEPLFSYFLSFGSLVVQIYLLIAGLALLSLNV